MCFAVFLFWLSRDLRTVRVAFEIIFILMLFFCQLLRTITFRFVFVVVPRQ